VTSPIGVNVCVGAAGDSKEGKGGLLAPGCGVLGTGVTVVPIAGENNCMRTAGVKGVDDSVLTTLVLTSPMTACRRMNGDASGVVLSAGRAEDTEGSTAAEAQTCGAASTPRLHKASKALQRYGSEANAACKYAIASGFFPTDLAIIPSRYTPAAPLGIADSCCKT
jgi:hypothetical protein